MTPVSLEVLYVDKLNKKGYDEVVDTCSFRREVTLYIVRPVGSD